MMTKEERRHERELAFRAYETAVEDLTAAECRAKRLFADLARVLALHENGKLGASGDALVEVLQTKPRNTKTVECPPRREIVAAVKGLESARAREADARATVQRGTSPEVFRRLVQP